MELKELEGEEINFITLDNIMISNGYHTIFNDIDLVKTCNDAEDYGEFTLVWEKYNETKDEISSCYITFSLVYHDINAEKSDILIKNILM